MFYRKVRTWHHPARDRQKLRRTYCGPLTKNCEIRYIKYRPCETRLGHGRGSPRRSIGRVVVGEHEDEVADRQVDLTARYRDNGSNVRLSNAEKCVYKAARASLCALIAYMMVALM